MNRFLGAVLAFAISMITAYGSSAEIPLTHGYFLAKSNAWQHVICNQRRTVVVPWDVTKFAVVDGYIVGYSKVPDRESFKKGALEGSFLIDGATGEIHKGLRHSTLENLLSIKQLDPEKLQYTTVE